MLRQFHHSTHTEYQQNRVLLILSMRGIGFSLYSYFWLLIISNIDFLFYVFYVFYTRLPIRGFLSVFLLIPLGK
jgi:hypothetical protein